MDDIAHHLPKMSRILRQKVLLWAGYRDVEGLPPRLSHLPLEEFTGIDLPVAISEAIRTEKASAPTDFQTIYLNPQLRILKTGAREGGLHSEMPISRPGTRSFSAYMNAVNLGRAQFIELTPEHDGTQSARVQALLVPLRGDNGETNHVLGIFDLSEPHTYG
ncbi:hypothetical protein J4E08_07460 [Sagittula sp. NFXS13]|uniref:hypothetical protein n=1 Tax=Sagittula sp. NFXS13 TaxID=2819095 RepID=UPI0032DF593C